MANTYTSSSLDSSLNKAKSCFRAVLLAANDTACEPVDVTTDVFAGSLQIDKSFNFLSAEKQTGKNKCKNEKMHT